MFKKGLIDDEDIRNFNQGLEELSNDIKRSDISLEDALRDFEEGIKLAKGLETLPERGVVLKNNIEVKFIDFVEGKSTTNIISKINSK